ncbi:MAG: hypothetical protein H0W83_01560 [Planctomycetes bacterium]|nr:hypothetical protein [Planctomycetota bacterium]
MSVVVERTFHLANLAGHRGGYRRSICRGAEPSPPSPLTVPGRVPRVAKLMALAIRCDHLIRTGAVPDATALARLAHVTQPRMTQILNLTLLAPNIQEALLFLSPLEHGKPKYSEKKLRHICAEPSWVTQRRYWSKLASVA